MNRTNNSRLENPVSSGGVDVAVGVVDGPGPGPLGPVLKDGAHNKSMACRVIRED